MNVLVLSSYRPDGPDGGAALRNWQNINALATLGPVDVLSACVEPGAAGGCVRHWTAFGVGDASAADRIRHKGWFLRPGGHPGVDAYRLGAAVRWLRERPLRYDVAVLETISMAPYLEDARRVATQVVFDAHNVEGALYEAALAARTAGRAPLHRRIKDRVLISRMREVERRVVLGASLVWACSDHDAEQLARAYGRRTGVLVVPNAVDVEAYRRPEAIPAGSDWTGFPPTIVYPGTFAFPPNEDAALRLMHAVLPALRRLGCPARLMLVGRAPTEAMRVAARQQAAFGEIVVTGAVPSVLPYLEQPCVVALPITVGSGTRLKILEAFAAGRPVVATAKAAEGIAARDGRDLLIRDDPDAMAEAVVEIWRSTALRASICSAALDLVRRQYSWSVAARLIRQQLAPGTDAPHGRELHGLGRQARIGVR